jgi:hypothetical protein
MLLQSAGKVASLLYHYIFSSFDQYAVNYLGFLDIDKIIEYREPLFLNIPYVKFWKKPRTPQCKWIPVL